MADLGSEETRDLPARLGEVSLVTTASQAGLAGKGSREHRDLPARDSEAPTGSLGCPATLELKVSQGSQVTRVYLVTQQVSALRILEHGQEGTATVISQQVLAVAAQDHRDSREHREHLESQVPKVRKDCQEYPDKDSQDGKDSSEPQDQEFQAQKVLLGLAAGREPKAMPGSQA